MFFDRSIINVFQFQIAIKSGIFVQDRYHNFIKSVQELSKEFFIIVLLHINLIDLL
jgi:hypothetical protein